MYSIDLENIALDEFKEILAFSDLLPGRRILLENLPEIIGSLKQSQILHLEALRKLLQNKKHYPELAKTLPVSVDYLTVLNREVNSYLSKPVPLFELGVFSAVELEKLVANAALKTTKGLYEQAASPARRQEIAAHLALPPEKIIHAATQRPAADQRRRSGLCRQPMANRPPQRGRLPGLSIRRNPRALPASQPRQGQTRPERY